MGHRVCWAVVGLDLGGPGELLAQAAGIHDTNNCNLVAKSCRDTRAVGVPRSTSRLHALEPGQVVVVVARAGGVRIINGGSWLQVLVWWQGGSRHMHSGKDNGQWWGLKPSADATALGCCVLMWLQGPITGAGTAMGAGARSWGWWITDGRLQGLAAGNWQYRLVTGVRAGSGHQSRCTVLSWHCAHTAAGTVASCE